MEEIEMKLLEGEEVRLFLPITKQGDIIFKLGGNVVGCVDASTTRHFDFRSAGIFFDATSFYNKEYIDGIRWEDCGLFRVRNAQSGWLRLENENDESYEIKMNVPEGMFASETMEEIISFKRKRSPLTEPLT